jgi:adenosylmethionine-8-amino-7-oxononanoate aminotransferase
MISACARPRLSRTRSWRLGREGGGLHRRADQGAGGVKIPPASYWPEIQRICRKYDVLLMLDEVITGYGRTGNWFAAQTFGIEPDTITTAKALTSGYQPLSALLVGDRIAGRWSRRAANSTTATPIQGIRWPAPWP